MQGGRGSPSPGALGPAAGRISVYEQRAKILFELGRAQASAVTSNASNAYEEAADEILPVSSTAPSVCLNCCRQWSSCRRRTHYGICCIVSIALLSTSKYLKPLVTLHWWSV